MEYTGYELLWLFFTYSVVGWMIETAFAAVKKKKFINRGILNGPVCVIYGIAAVVISVFLAELSNHLFFLFLGSSAIATFLEWQTGRMLEKINQQKWWDYSAKKWNLDGYICLQYSVVWGILGVLAVKLVNRGLLFVMHLLPEMLLMVIIWLGIWLIVFDFIGSAAAILHIKKDIPGIRKVNSHIGQTTLKIGMWIVRHIENRMAKAYPLQRPQRIEKAASDKFAEGLCFYKVFILFVAGAFLGDIIETVFCRITAGVWMSRSSLVWGPFSIVWGLAIAIATTLLYNSRSKPDRSLFFVGVFLGGAYEYLCSVFTELVFGTVFWDYSELPFNLGGRINLLYCFFWGIVAVVWMKAVYPKLSLLIEQIPKRAGTMITWLLLLFMVCNIIVSMMALIRYDTRAKGEATGSSWEAMIDSRFPDERIEQIYPNAIRK